MKTLLAAVITATLLALPSVGNAAWIHDEAGNTIQPYAGWAATSLTPAPNADITVIVGDVQELCPGADACDVPGTIYIQPSPDERYIFLHELGHEFDRVHMTDRARATFRRLAGIPAGADWLTDPSGGDVFYGNPPDEKFAEAYSWCARRGPKLVSLQGGSWMPEYNYDPRIKTQPAICRLISRAATTDQK